MIITRLSGGIGNQMFQYAMGRRLSLIHNTRLKLDISHFSKSTLRHYELDHFNINADIANTSDLKSLGISTSRLGLKIYLLLEKNHIYQNPSFVIQKSNRFNPDFLKLPNDVYLWGEWQSERYFKEVELLIREELTVKNPLSGKNEKMAKIISSVEAISLHVRRGDYVSDRRTNESYGALSSEYYEKAVKEIGKRVKNPVFFMFSDDISWTKEHIKTGHPTYFLDFNGPDNAHEDLRLMSMCKYHIIANSSFSWWGSWLSIFNRKIAIAPKRMFKADVPFEEIEPFICDFWIRV